SRASSATRSSVSLRPLTRRWPSGCGGVASPSPARCFLWRSRRGPPPRRRASLQRVPPPAYETVAQWRRRARVSEPAELLLVAIAQGTPAAPLRVADAQGLNLDPSLGKGT